MRGVYNGCVTSRRTRRALAVGVCLVVVLAAVLPGLAAFEFVLLPLAWEPAPDEASLTVAAAPVDAAFQPLSLRSLLPSRAPPVADVA